NYILRNIREGMNVVDVGANIGYFSVLLGYKVGQSGKVTSYEPNPKVYQLLLDNLTLNEHKHNAVAKRKGVSSIGGEVNFHISNRFQGNSSIKQHSEKYKKDFKSDEFSQTKIEVVSLDQENLGYIDFLKVDTEGGEYHVFLGMKNILANKQVDTVVFELNKSMLQKDIEPFYKLLKSYEGDYCYYLLTPNGDLIKTSIDYIYQKDYIDNIVMKKG
ncbi:MAG TPA: FkbM family methyltransferase, partial [Geobacterales bacterium]|nr:FkbM family methyltransferase [Geobacterales bacterium]